MHIASRCRLCFLQQKLQSLSGFKLIASSKMPEASSCIIRELQCYSFDENIKPLKSMYMSQAGQMEKIDYRDRHCKTFFMLHHNPHQTGLPQFQYCYPGSYEHEHLAANPAALHSLHQLSTFLNFQCVMSAHLFERGGMFTSCLLAATTANATSTNTHSLHADHLTLFEKHPMM